ncbi:hypothetical protein JA1_001655 [Spathaspora sp. JA1]|nr:hypothetical protein JA1_001655 [Spathaspora sp. JA1]
MPVEFSNSNSENVGDVDFNELRVSIIGNKDLKYKLVGDVEFINKLVDQFNQSILEIVEKKKFVIGTNNGGGVVQNFQFLHELEKKAVILNILCTFIIEVNTNKNDNITKCLRLMEQVINPLIHLLNYFVEKFVPQLYMNPQIYHNSNADEDGDVIRKVENLIGYSLDILLGLANIRDHNINSSMLWRFITSLFIVTDDSSTLVASKTATTTTTSQNIFQINSCLLIKSLKLVPLLLSQASLSNNSITTLLTALLNRLSKECDLIIATHFLDISKSNALLHELAFENSCLPNIELNKPVLRRVVDVNLLLELIVCTAQIFSFSKFNDYDILMAAPDTTGQNKSSSEVVLSINVYLSLLLLVKYEDKQLNLAALNLICFYLNNLRPSKDIDDEMIYKSYKKLLPRIIAMLELEQDFTGSTNLKKHDKDATQNTAGGGTSNIVTTTAANSSRAATATGLNTSPSSNLLSSAFNKKQQPRTSGLSLDLPLFLSSPGKILADLCAQYPLLNDEINDANIDYRLVKKLETNFKSSQLLKALKILKRESKNGKILVDFTLLLTIDRDDNCLADLLLLLSVYTSSTEEYRARIINRPQENTKNSINLTNIIFQIIDNYHFLLTQAQLIYKLLYPKKGKQKSTIPKNDLPWFGKNLGIIRSLMDSEIYTNCFYFIRSLSRSVSSLRTFFVECNALTSFISDDTNSSNASKMIAPSTAVSNSTSGSRSITGISGVSSGISSSASTSSPGGLIVNLLEIIRVFENLDQMLDFFYNLNKIGNSGSNGSKNKRAQMTNKSICIGLLANFILDFSSFRYAIIGYENFLSSLSIIYQNSSTDFDKSLKLDKLTEEEIFQRNEIQLKILQVIKNFMYNETTENKQELMDYFALIYILKKASYGIGDYNYDPNESTDISKLRLEQKLVAFDILRNFTAGSPTFNVVLINTYEQEFANNMNQLPDKWFQFLSSNIRNVKLFIPNAKSKETFDNDETLVKLISNDDYVSLVRSVNYIEDHKYTMAEKIKRESFPNDELLKIWLRLLSFFIPENLEKKFDLNTKIVLNSNLNLIKSSITWIILNLTWKYSTYSFNVHDYTDYEVYQTVESSRHVTTNHRIYIDESDDESEDKREKEKPEPEESDSNEDELSVRQRAKYLDKLGYTAVIVKLMNYYSKQASSSSSSATDSELLKPSKIGTSSSSSYSALTPKRFDIQNSHDISEKLKTALRQITSLLRTKNSSSGSSIDKKIIGSAKNELRIRLNEDASGVQVVEDHDEDVHEGTYRRHHNRRSHVDSEDEAHEDDQEEEDDDDDDEEEGGPADDEDDDYDDDDDEFDAYREDETEAGIEEFYSDNDEPVENWI